MSVQYQQQGRSLLDDAHPRMAVAVNSPLVPLGRPEPPFQLQVVLGRLLALPTSDAHKQSRLPTAHQLGEVGIKRPALVLIGALQALVTPPPLPERSRALGQRPSDSADLLHLFLDLLLLRAYRRQS